jgi:hypothetical protein
VALPKGGVFCAWSRTLLKIFSGIFNQKFCHLCRFQEMEKGGWAAITKKRILLDASILTSRRAVLKL